MNTKYKFELIPEWHYKSGNYSPKIVHYAEFSERWYRNAKLEVAGTNGRESTRKEIICAASFLETYIFEWARTIAFENLDEYFPPMPRFQIDPRFKRTLSNKWKQIPAELYADKIIPVCLKLKLVPLGTLAKYRHRLMHASAGRSVAALESVAHGWALDVARRLVLDFHDQLGTPPPAYL
jgi:hypothetical protein